MKKQQALKQVIASEVKSLLREDYARGISDFAISQVASNAKEDLKRILFVHINQTVKDPTEKTKKINSANTMLRELESEMKELLEKRLLNFIRSV